MVDDVAEKTRSVIDAARARRAPDTAPRSDTAAGHRAASDAPTLLAPVADGTADTVAQPEPELIPAAIAPVVSTSRRALSFLLLIVVGLAAGIAVGTGILAAITWISDAALTSFA